jgi:hypothetical protein
LQQILKFIVRLYVFFLVNFLELAPQWHPVFNITAKFP